MSQACKIATLQPDMWQIPITITLGLNEIMDYIEICCPNQKEKGKKQDLRYNGHDTSVKGAPQQILCTTCGKSFYPHTSKFFKNLKREIRSTISQPLKRGR
ncbi:MAG: hypothetical protein K9W44_00195 [Candidatus Lokiarchaeota archaeon]|nr:hypothetical protein [Candidatus Harpocratesius repetitus]